MNLAINNCRLICEGTEVIRNILVRNRKIKKITKGKIKAKKALDARGNYVLPGIIDPHVHFREPGFEHKENLFTGSVAAAAGGITTFLDMPNTEPNTTTCKALGQKKKLARKSVANYGFHFGAAVDNIEEIRKARSKTASTKLFMNLSTGKMMIEDKCKIEQIFENSRIVAVHAEKEKVAEAVAFAKNTGTRLYLCHISMKDEIDFLRKAKTRNIFVEATPHHLFLTKKDFKKMKGFADMKPSLKAQKDQDALWNAIKDGVIDTIGSDHAPHTKEEKKKKKWPAGVPGCETSLPLMLDAVNKGRISLTKVVRMMSENPARIFRIKNKGKIKVGYDADLVIVDMDKKRRVANSRLFTKCKWSPFNGKILKGWPIITIAGGNVVFDETGFHDVKAKGVVYDGS